MDTLTRLALLEGELVTLEEQSSKLIDQQMLKRDEVQKLKNQYILEAKLLARSWTLVWNDTLSGSRLVGVGFYDIPELVKLVVDRGYHETFYVPFGDDLLEYVTLNFDDNEIEIRLSCLTDEHAFEFLNKYEIVVELKLIDRELERAEQGVKSLYQIKELFK